MCTPKYLIGGYANALPTLHAEIQAGFYWSTKDGKAKCPANIPFFIREYCSENDLPIIFFGK